MVRAWDDGDKEAAQAEVSEASEEDSAADRVEVSEVPAVLVADSVTVRAEVLVVSEGHMEETPVEVLEAPAA